MIPKYDPLKQLNNTPKDGDMLKALKQLIKEHSTKDLDEIEKLDLFGPTFEDSEHMDSSEYNRGVEDSLVILRSIFDYHKWPLYKNNVDKILTEISNLKK